MQDTTTLFYSHCINELPQKWATLFDDAISSGLDPHQVDTYRKLTQHTFNSDSPSKGMFRLVRDCLSDPRSVAHLLLIQKMVQAEFNVDAVIQAARANKNKEREVEELVKLRIKDINALRAHYNERRIIRLMWETPLKGFRDTMDMMSYIKERVPDAKYLPAKPKSIDHLHNLCVRMMPKINVENFSLKQREDILLMDNTALNDELTIRVPKTHYDLIDLGEDLGFCIGNGSYSQGVKNGAFSIIALFDKKGARYGIQFSRYKILEAQGLGNLPEHRPKPALLRVLRERFTEAPRLPSHFLPITDSGWIHGYRYNNKDLYLLMNQMVYVYFDVPEDAYEALLNSEVKGAHFNKHFRNKYAYERVGHIDTLDVERA